MILSSDPRARTRFLRHVVTLSPAAGTAALLLTGMMFLAGWSEKQALLSRFGIAAALMQEPFQTTLARGYLPLLVGAVALAAFLVLGWAGLRLEGFFWRTVFRFLPKRKPTEILEETLNAVTPYNRASFYAISALLILIFPAVAGTASGSLRYRLAAARVADGCVEGCFDYRTGNGRAIGVPVAQDATRIAVFGADGLRLIKADDVKIIRPHIATAPTAGRR
jgi:hypothetical protein